VIRSLRRAHRWVWMALVLLLPWLVAAALAARRSVAPQPLPPELAPYARPAEAASR